jgi:hypothetical protein
MSRVRIFAANAPPASVLFNVQLGQSLREVLVYQPDGALLILDESLQYLAYARHQAVAGRGSRNARALHFRASSIRM